MAESIQLPIQADLDIQNERIINVRGLNEAGDTLEVLGTVNFGSATVTGLTFTHDDITDFDTAVNALIAGGGMGTPAIITAADGTLSFGDDDVTAATIRNFIGLDDIANYPTLNQDTTGNAVSADTVDLHLDTDSTGVHVIAFAERPINSGDPATLNYSGALDFVPDANRLEVGSTGTPGVARLVGATENTVITGGSSVISVGTNNYDLADIGTQRSAGANLNPTPRTIPVTNGEPTTTGRTDRVLTYRSAFHTATFVTTAGGAGEIRLNEQLAQAFGLIDTAGDVISATIENVQFQFHYQQGFDLDSIFRFTGNLTVEDTNDGSATPFRIVFTQAQWEQRDTVGRASLSTLVSEGITGPTNNRGISIHFGTSHGVPVTGFVDSMLTVNEDGDIFYKQRELNSSEYDLTLTAQGLTIADGATTASFQNLPSHSQWSVGNIGFAKSADNTVAFNFTVSNVDQASLDVTIDHIFRFDEVLPALNPRVFNAKGTWELTTGQANFDTDTDTRPNFAVGTTTFDSPTSVTFTTGSALGISGDDNSPVTITLPTTGTADTPIAEDIFGDYTLPVVAATPQTFQVSFRLNEAITGYSVQWAGAQLSTIQSDTNVRAIGTHVIEVELTAAEATAVVDNSDEFSAPVIRLVTSNNVVSLPILHQAHVGDIADWAREGNTDIIPHAKTDHPNPVSVVLRGDHYLIPIQFKLVLLMELKLHSRF